MKKFTVLLTALTASTALFLTPASAQVRDLGMGAMEQIKAEAAEEAAPMSRGVNLRTINPSFNSSSQKDNVRHHKFAPETTYKVRLAEFMRSLIVLPPEEKIVWFVLGDSAGFDVQQVGEGSNVLAIRGKYPGADTSLQVQTSTRRIYSFYLRNDPHDSKYPPDLVVYVDNHDNSLSPQVKEYDLTPKQADMGREQKLMLDIVAKSYGKEPKDYLRSLPEPDKLNVSYSIKGNSEEIAPYAVWDDGNWTWFRFYHPQHKRGSSRLPVVYQVVDGFDSYADVRSMNVEDGVVLVATRVSREGWTLRNGDKHICIKANAMRQEVNRNAE